MDREMVLVKLLPLLLLSLCLPVRTEEQSDVRVVHNLVYPDSHLFNVRSPRTYWVQFAGDHFTDHVSTRFFVSPIDIHGKDPCGSIPEQTHTINIAKSTDTLLQSDQPIQIVQGVQHPLGHAVCLSIDHGDTWKNVGTLPLPCNDVITVGALFISIYMFIAYNCNNPNTAVYQALPAVGITYLIVFLDSVVSPPVLLGCVAVLLLITYQLLIDADRAATALVILLVSGWYLWIFFAPQPVRKDVELLVEAFLEWSTSGVTWMCTWVGIPFLCKFLCDCVTRHPEGDTTLSTIYGWFGYVVISTVLWFDHGECKAVEQSAIVTALLIIGYLAKQQGFGCDCFATTQHNRLKNTTKTTQRDPYDACKEETFERASSTPTIGNNKDSEEYIKLEDNIPTTQDSSVDPSPPTSVYSQIVDELHIVRTDTTLLVEREHTVINTTQQPKIKKSSSRRRKSFDGDKLEAEEQRKEIYTSTYGNPTHTTTTTPSLQYNENASQQALPAHAYSHDMDDEMVDASPPLERRRSQRNIARQASKRTVEQVEDKQDTPTRPPKALKRSASSGSKSRKRTE